MPVLYEQNLTHDLFNSLGNVLSLSKGNTTSENVQSSGRLGRLGAECSGGAKEKLNGIEFSLSTEIGLVFDGFSMGSVCMETPTIQNPNWQPESSCGEQRIFFCPVGESPHLQVLVNQPHSLMPRRNPEG